MLVKCTAYIWPNGTVMIHQSGDKDYLDKWVHPDEKKRAQKVTLNICYDEVGKEVLGIGF